MSIVRIHESADLPLYYGTIEVDTSSYGVTILMNSVPEHNNDQTLTITKISGDNNIITLFSNTCTINNSDIVIFGLSPFSKFKNGKNKTVTLKSDGKNWNIIKEY